MRQLILSTLLIALAFSAGAQNRLGIFAGPQYTTARYSIAGKEQDTRGKPGFFAGANMKVPFDVNLYFAPQIFYSLKGYKATFSAPSSPPDVDALDNNLTMHSLELAMLLQYDFGNQPSRFFLRAGPSLDFQLFGRERFRKANNDIVGRQLVFGFQDYGHYSANLLVHLGVETRQGFVVTAQYSHGLTNINNRDKGPRIKHTIFGLGLGKYLR